MMLCLRGVFLVRLYGLWALLDGQKRLYSHGLHSKGQPTRTGKEIDRTHSYLLTRPHN